MRFWVWLIARLAVAALLVGWVFAALFLPDSGKEELQRSLAALKKIDTLHYAMTSDNPIQRTEIEGDLVCSEGAFYRKTHVQLHDPKNPVAADLQTLRTDGKQYNLMSNGYWRHDPFATETAETTCGKIAQGQQSWILPDLSSFIEHGIIEKGDKKTIDGKRCREWKIADLSGPGSLRRHGARHVTLCLDLDDHLPREMVLAESNSHWTYDFNQAVHIQVPEPLEAEQPREAYQPPPNPGLTLADPDER
jgi:hypothetical protein